MGFGLRDENTVELSAALDDAAEGFVQPERMTLAAHGTKCGRLRRALARIHGFAQGTGKPQKVSRAPTFGQATVTDNYLPAPGEVEHVGRDVVWCIELPRGWVQAPFGA